MAGPETYQELLESTDPQYAALFNKLLPNGVDSPKTDFMTWKASFEDALENETKGMSQEDQTLIRGYAVLVKKYYSRNCYTLNQNDKMVTYCIENLPALKHESETVEIVHEIGRAIMDKFVIKTNSITRTIYRYDEKSGVFKPDGQVFIEQVIKKNGLKLSKHDIAEITYHIQASTFEDPSNFKGAITGSNMLHVRNGWLNMDTGVLEEHSPDYLSTAIIDVEYDPRAGPIEFVKVVNQALSPEYRRLLFKVMGNILIPDCRFEKATMFVGDGHNRKSTILMAIRNVIGADNCSTVAIQELDDDRFAAAELYGKMLNIVYDLKADTIKSTGRFKEAVSGDPLRGQFKHKDPFTFRPIAKHISSANKIPQSNDESDAYIRRWIIIPFYHTFDRDPAIQERLQAEKEKSGILNLMLYGRKLLMTEGFDDVPLEKIRAMYSRNASLVKDFVEEKCILDIANDSRHNMTRTDIMQSAYWTFNEEKKGRKLTDSEHDFLRRQLGQELQKIGVEHKRLWESNSSGSSQRAYFYVGIRLRDKLQTEL